MDTTRECVTKVLLLLWISSTYCGSNELLGCSDKVKRCYVHEYASLTFNDSRRHCEGKGWEVLTMENVDVYNVLKSLYVRNRFPRKTVWLGMAPSTPTTDSPRCPTKAFKKNTTDTLCSEKRHFLCLAWLNNTRGNCFLKFQVTCIFGNDVRMTWYQARQYCFMHGAVLLTKSYAQFLDRRVGVPDDVRIDMSSIRNVTSRDDTPLLPWPSPLPPGSDGQARPPPKDPRGLDMRWFMVDHWWVSDERYTSWGLHWIPQKPITFTNWKNRYPGYWVPGMCATLSSVMGQWSLTECDDTMSVICQSNYDRGVSPDVPRPTFLPDQRRTPRNITWPRLPDIARPTTPMGTTSASGYGTKTTPATVQQKTTKLTFPKSTTGQTFPSTTDFFGSTQGMLKTGRPGMTTVSRGTHSRTKPKPTNRMTESISLFSSESSKQSLSKIFTTPSLVRRISSTPNAPTQTGGNTGEERLPSVAKTTSRSFPTPVQYSTRDTAPATKRRGRPPSIARTTPGPHRTQGPLKPSDTMKTTVRGGPPSIARFIPTRPINISPKDEIVTKPSERRGPPSIARTTPPAGPPSIARMKPSSISTTSRPRPPGFATSPTVPPSTTTLRYAHGPHRPGISTTTTPKPILRTTTPATVQTQYATSRGYTPKVKEKPGDNELDQIWLPTDMSKSSTDGQQVDQTESNGGLLDSPGFFFGIGVGGLCFIALIAVAIVIICQRKRKKVRKTPPPSVEWPPFTMASFFDNGRHTYETYITPMPETSSVSLNTTYCRAIKAEDGQVGKIDSVAKGGQP